MRKRACGLLWFLIFIFLSSDAFAFRLTPMHMVFAPSGKESTRTFYVSNEKKEKIAVKVSVAYRNMKEDGSEEMPDASKKFSVFPRQFTLAGNTRRAVRVTWRGEKQPDKELAYRIIAEQLAVDGLQKRDKKGALIKILLRFVGAMYVEPKGVEPDLFVEEAKLVKKVKGKRGPQLFLKFHNKGKKHKVFIRPKLKISSKKQKKELTLEGKDVKVIDGHNVLAQSRRIFYMPWPKQIVQGSVQVKLETE